MSTFSLQSLYNLDSLGTGELRPSVVLRLGGTKGFTKLRGYLDVTLKLNFDNISGESMRFLKILNKNIRSCMSLRLQSESIANF